MAVFSLLQHSAVWHIDSGAADHMCQSKDAFESYSTMQKKVYMADGKHTMAIGIGSVVLHVVQPQGTGKITVTNVLHTPELSANLLSVSCLTTKGASVEFKAMTCNVYGVNGNCLAVAKKTGSLFNLQLAKPESEANVAVAKATCRNPALLS